MNISIGCDHGGYELKEHLKVALAGWGHAVNDRGTHGKDSVDYPDYAQAVGEDLQSGAADLAVLICTTGLGIAMAANKMNGVRAAVVHNEDAAEFSRSHNNANVICFGQKYDTHYMAEKCTKIFLETAFEGGRHERRVNKVTAMGCGQVEA